MTDFSLINNGSLDLTKFTANKTHVIGVLLFIQNVCEFLNKDKSIKTPGPTSTLQRTNILTY